MGLRRRRFLRFLIGGWTVLAVAGVRCLKESPPRLAGKLRRWKYPGPLEALDEAEVRKPGRWLG